MPTFFRTYFGCHKPHDDSEDQEDCIFCGVDGKTEGFQVIWENDNLVAFDDRNPAAKHHILVCPKRHVESVRTLTKDDLPLLKEMHETGISLLDNLDIPELERRMGFHIPPFNSVNHLHMHVQALPYVSFIRSLKYPVVPGYGKKHKGFGWFAEIEQTIGILEDGGTVGVLPC